MRLTIDLPDVLGQRVDGYLSAHPEMSLSSLVAEVLQDRLAEKDPNEILKLAGLVQIAGTNARDRAEDEYADRAG